MSLRWHIPPQSFCGGAASSTYWTMDHPTGPWTIAAEGCLSGYLGDGYTALGGRFIEAHHIKPVHTLTPGSKTRLEDLVLLCSNCNRMVHVQRPWLSIHELRQLLCTEFRSIIIIDPMRRMPSLRQPLAKFS